MGAHRRSRREFLQCVVYSGLGGYLAFASGACRKSTSSNTDGKEGRSFLTRAEYLTTAAACERILPHDEDAGAIDLDVPVYIDRALGLDDYRKWGRRFREGLRALDAESLDRTKTAFHLASADDQDSLLEDFEAGSPEQAEFFKMLLHFTLEGAFGDPSHGGNKGGLGWRLIGFQPGEPMPSMHHSPG